ncbi:hypothetical protein ACLB1T_30660 [Escherichia coli]
MRTNSSGQAPVVLTSNKVGTYTVTASFHNGVTIQTQTTVKVTSLATQAPHMLLALSLIHRLSPPPTVI